MLMKENEPAAPRTKDACKRELVRAGVSLPTSELKLAEYQRLWRIRVAGAGADERLSNPPASHSARARASDAYCGRLDLLEARAQALGTAPVPLSIQAALAERLAPSQEQQAPYRARSSSRSDAVRESPPCSSRLREHGVSPARVGAEPMPSVRSTARPHPSEAEWRAPVSLSDQRPIAAAAAAAPARRSASDEVAASVRSPRQARWLVLPALAFALLALGTVAFDQARPFAEVPIARAVPRSAHVELRSAPPILDVAAPAEASEVLPVRTPQVASLPLRSDDDVAARGARLASRPSAEEHGAHDGAGRAGAEATRMAAVAEEHGAHDGAGRAGAEATRMAAEAEREAMVRDVSVPDKLVLLSAIVLWRVLSCCALLGGAALRVGGAVGLRGCTAMLSLAWHSPLLTLFTALALVATHALRSLMRRWTRQRERGFVTDTSRR